MSIEYCENCDEETGNAGRGDDSVFVVRNGKEIGPLCDTCCNDFLCPQCGEVAEELHEGYCEDCCNQNQAQLDRHNEEYAHWHRLDDEMRDEAIRRGYT